MVTYQAMAEVVIATISFFVAGWMLGFLLKAQSLEGGVPKMLIFLVLVALVGGVLGVHRVNEKQAMYHRIDK